MVDSIGAGSARTALVVGAGSGIGRAVAELFASRGIRTVAADLEPGAVRSLAASHEHNRRPRRPRWDATDPQACTGPLTDAAVAVDCVDLVISTVGWTAITRFLEETPEYWRRIVDVNLMSAIYLSPPRPGHEGAAAAASSSPAPKPGRRPVRRDGVLRGQGGRRRAGARHSPASGHAIGSASTSSPRVSPRRRCWRARAASAPEQRRRAIPMRRAGAPRRSRRPSSSCHRTRRATSPDRPCASAAGSR